LSGAERGKEEILEKIASKSITMHYWFPFVMVHCGRKIQKQHYKEEVLKAVG
jgi:hypothetical protein